MMISFEKESSKFQVRVGGIVLHNNKILLQRAIENEKWFLPGGRAEFFENAGTTIEWEIMEEFAVPVVDKKLVWFVENFTTYPAMHLHEIAFYFLVTLLPENPIFLKELEFIGEEPNFVNRWVSLAQLDNYFIIPQFVVSELKIFDINLGVKHLVNREIR
ncbi:NUDIX domain-containing protein [Paenibacillus sp. WQ 127069]|uniref:NUDIX domain-containing protein n=1 Tax=Paenibacillus baimaensis TaxID=2982185 RepID=A0ABT2UIS7_9BACL|nr:NUDIX domain-containing protein [Paenibacillus sp. WQ 127069]MCU6793782.1 NUDIX domain-containing protein [Paenibacillus sp. WQ 127069]